MTATLTPWMSAAELLIGLKEQPGAGSNPVIAKWIADLKAPISDDDEAWCALFANRLLSAFAFPTSGTGYDLVRAASFKGYGVDLTEPAYGAILVFVRPGGAHVGFYVGESPTAYRVRGGNQSNSVSDTWIEKARCVAVRWPPNWPRPMGGRVELSSLGQPLSTNEA